MVFVLTLPGIGAKLNAYIAHPVVPNQTVLPELDGLRGLAALYVAAGHLWYFKYWATYPVQQDFEFIAYATKGVPVFVILSGFLIYRSYLTATGLEGLRSYVIRRFFRIYPLYAFSVLLLALLGRMEARDSGFDAVSLFISELLMFRVLGGPEVFANPVAWSIHVEMLFYAFLPLYVLLVPKRHFLPASIVIFFLMLAADQYYTREFSMWKYFMAGIIAAEFGHRFRIGAFWATVCFLIGCVAFVVDIQGPTTDYFAQLGILRPSSNYFTLGLAIAMFLILVGIDQRAWFALFLYWAPVRHIGIVSYSLFLLHPIYVVLNFSDVFLPHIENIEDRSLTAMPTWFFLGVYLTGMIFWATAAYLLVEKPMIRYGKRLARRVAPLSGDTIKAGL